MTQSAPTTTFVTLGGDSIRAAVFFNRLQRALGEVISVATISEVPTVAGLAAHLSRHHPDAAAKAAAHGGSADFEGWTAASGRAQAPVPTTGGTPIAPSTRRPTPDSTGAQPRDSAENGNRPAVFILAPPRSGSTLLRVMLGGHPDLFAPPELELLSYENLAERKAALAERSSAWVLEGLTRAVMALRDWSADEAERTVKDWESRRLSTMECYRTMQDWLGYRTLVDKTASYSFNLSTLHRAEAAFRRPMYIHLLRHPRAMVRSFEDVGLDRIVLSDQQHDFPVRELAESIWLNSHQNILEFLHTVPAHRQHRVMFEELVTGPHSVVKDLCRFLGLSFHPGMLRPYEEQEARMVNGIRPGSSMVGDPTFLAKHTIDPQTADRWRTDSNEDLLGDITWQLAESLGYERPGQSDVQQQSSQGRSTAPTLSARTGL